MRPHSRGCGDTLPSPLFLHPPTLLSSLPSLCPGFWVRIGAFGYRAGWDAIRRVARNPHSHFEGIRGRGRRCPQEWLVLLQQRGRHLYQALMRPSGTPRETGQEHVCREHGALAGALGARQLGTGTTDRERLAALAFSLRPAAGLKEARGEAARSTIASTRAAYCRTDSHFGTSLSHRNV